MEFLIEYGLFLAKTVTFVVAFAVIIALVVSSSMKGQGEDKGHIEIRALNKKYEEIKAGVRASILDPKAYKEEEKAQKKAEKEKNKAAKKEAKRNKQAAKVASSEPEASSESPIAELGDDTGRKRLFVVDFDGDVRASATAEFRRVVTAILSIARSTDEVVVRLESQGGMVHSYGLASSQLARFSSKGIPLTICVDKVAASGGYMMACVADKIVAAPFAILGSIGVVAQLPNFHRVLKKNDIDYEMLTAGEYKRTLTMFGENTEKGRQKFVEDLEDTHVLFKDFINEHRPTVEIEKVATGEIWFGSRAIDQSLVDSLQTSDEYIYSHIDTADIFELEYVTKKPLLERLGINTSVAIESAVDRLWQKFSNSKNFFQ